MPPIQSRSVGSISAAALLLVALTRERSAVCAAMPVSTAGLRLMRCQKQVSLLLQLNVSHVDEETIVWPPLATVLLLEVRLL